MGDDLTLTPVYHFEWSDGTSRRTDDDDFSTEEDPAAEAIETLAVLGREDPDCSVDFIGMGN